MDQWQNFNRFIPQVISGCLDNREFETSLAEQVRDFCYVDDVVNAILLSLDNEQANGKVINIASGVPVKLKSVINLIQSIITMGSPKIGSLKLNKIENPSLYADISIAENVLKWKPQVDLSSGLKLTIEYYKSKKF